MKKFKISVLFIIVAVSADVNAQTNVISTSGDVGIGTLSPSAKLDVNGSLMVDSMATFKDSLRVQKKLIVEQNVKIQGKSVFVDDGKFKNNLKVLGVGRMKDKLVVDGLTKLNGDLKLMSLSNFPNATTFLTVNQNGKVGSFERISLVNAIYQPPQTCFTDMSGNIYPMWKQNPHQNYGILYTGVDCPVRVGIGTDSPLAKLDVHGSALFSSSVGIRSYNSSASFSSFYIRDNSSNRDVFRVMGDGHVWCTELDIKLKEDFPDYVFNTDYSLMPLDELENYIVENKHLPNIPSAEEVASNGVNVGEMQVKQMEKIEELTLYLLQLKKELDLIKEENSELKQLILGQ